MTPASLNNNQWRFMYLHDLRNDYVSEYRQLFQGATIMARTNQGKVATVSACEALELAQAGWMQPEPGGRFCLTNEGKALLIQ